MYGERPDAPRRLGGHASLRWSAYPRTSKAASAASAACCPPGIDDASPTSPQRSARWVRTHLDTSRRASGRSGNRFTRPPVGHGSGPWPWRDQRHDRPERSRRHLPPPVVGPRDVPARTVPARSVPDHPRRMTPGGSPRWGRWCHLAGPAGPRWPSPARDPHSRPDDACRLSSSSGPHPNSGPTTCATT